MLTLRGVHLKDLIAWHNNAIEFDKTGSICGKRLYQLAHLLSFFLGVNRMAHNFAEPNLDLINTLKVITQMRAAFIFKVSLDINYNENDIYDLSLKREPRTLLNVSSSQSGAEFRLTPTQI